MRNRNNNRDLQIKFLHSELEPFAKISLRPQNDSLVRKRWLRGVSWMHSRLRVGAVGIRGPSKNIKSARFPIFRF